MHSLPMRLDLWHFESTEADIDKIGNRFAYEESTRKYHNVITSY